MAFNPFHWFRKRQKVFLAALVVLCMVIFIFQFGQGDLFTRALAWFGQSRRGGEVVTTLYGKKVYTSDLEQLAARRKLASDFLFLEVYQALPQAMEELLKGPLKSTGESAPLSDAEAIARTWQRKLNRGLAESLGPNGPGALSLLHSLRKDLRELEEMAARPDIKGNKDRVEALNRLSTILGFQVWLLSRRVPNDFIRVFYSERVLPPEDYYFGGSRRVDDLLDFLVMKQQADKLGIKLTDEDVLREVSNEAGGVQLFEGRRFAQEKRINEFLQNNRVYATQTAKDLLDALRDELRVAMAQQMLLGTPAVALPPLGLEGRPLDEQLRQAPGDRFIPSTMGVRAYRGMLVAAGAAVATPAEFLDFYREECTALSVKMLPVPASKFLPKVKEKPTEEELRARFEKYRKVEPLPGSRDPGFKEPRRVALEGITIHTDSPAALKLGRQAHQVAQALASFGIVPVRLAAGVDAKEEKASREALTKMQAFPFYPLNVITFLAADPLLWEYGEYRGGLRAGQAPPGQDPRLLEAFSRQLRQTSPLEIFTRSFTARRLLERNAWLHTIGAMGFASQGLAYMPGSLTSLFAQPYLRTMRDHRQAVGMATAALFDPYKLTAVVGTMTSADLTPEPLSSMRPVLERHLDQMMAGRLARSALRQMKKDLAELPANSDAKARAIIDKVKAAFGAESFAMTTPISAVALLEALRANKPTGLEELRKAYTRSAANPMFAFGGMQPPDTTNEGFVRWLFTQPSGAYKPMAPGPRLGEGPGLEDFILGLSSDLVNFWFTKDRPAREPIFAEARPAVEASWMLERARQLARKKAEAIEEQINAKGLTPADAGRVLREQGLGEPFELTNVAPMVRPREPHFIGAANYRPYEVPEELRDKLTYPPPDLPRQLQVLKRPGDATVVSDRGEDTWYVAVLVERSEPTLKQFQEVYANSPRFDPLHERLQEKKSAELRQAVLAQLRREAGEVESSGRFKLPADVRSRDVGRSEE